MASLFFSKQHRKWRAKWWDGREWRYELLGEHPGWQWTREEGRGKPAPKASRAPAEVKRLFAALAQREQEIRMGKRVPEASRSSLADFCKAYLDGQRGVTVAVTFVRLELTFRRFEEFCAGKDVTHVEGVTPDICRAYLSSRLDAGNKISSTNTERAALAAAWAQAEGDGKIPSNPWKRVRLKGKERKERPPFWTEEQAAQLRSACEPWLADVVTVGFYSGIRISALLNLTWADIDFAKGRIHVRAARSKSGRPYDAPMLGPSRDVLQRLVAIGDGTGTVLRGSKGQRLHQGTTFDAIQRAARRAGIPDLGFYNHILRHSYATWAIGQGVPIKQVSRWMGHSSVAMTERYAHAAEGDSERWAEFLTTKAIIAG